MLNKLPENAKQLTPDRELFKLVVEEGNKKNRSSNLNDTCVAVFYIIKSGNENDSNSEVVDYTNKDKITAWIVGDKESESPIFLFLQIGIRFMCEGETSKFYFTRKYLFGDAPIINLEGKFLQSDTFFAIVKLVKASPLSEINRQPKKSEETKEQLQLKYESQQEKQFENTNETDSKELNKSEQIKNSKDTDAKNEKDLNKSEPAENPQNVNAKNEKDSNKSESVENSKDADSKNEKETDSKELHKSESVENSQNVNTKNETESNKSVSVENSQNANTKNEKEIDSKESKLVENSKDADVKNEKEIDSKESKPVENSKDADVKNDKKEDETENGEAFQRRKFALNQLQIAESLLHQKKPAAARKEFNRARMSWSTQVDLSKAPETIEHEALNYSEEELKKYVNSRALYGVARTYLEIEPPNTEKAVINIRESIEIDPEFFEAKITLESLGEKVEESEFPQFEDKRLTKQQYWLNPDVEWSKREEYSAYIKEKATAQFKENNFKEALDLYKKCIISFSGQSKQKANLTKEQISTMNKVNIISKLNCLACYLSLKEYSKVVVHAGELYDTILKMEPTIIDETNNNNGENAKSDGNNKTINETCENYKLKCLYRKALGFHELGMSEQVENTIKQLQDVKGSDVLIQAIRKKQQEDSQLSQKEQDVMFSKISLNMK